ncbi:hypothetical protein EYF80_003354 [Liparis tanakae]|uniref:Uncharacterized protein n=1 Tax=Liparis tanakae TaxID=230148 RepID=A0A4Z2J7V9_9TELE|nr:hypothetical protein EYF80_003354 [Liparis tanakae]
MLGTRNRGFRAATRHSTAELTTSSGDERNGGSWGRKAASSEDIRRSRQSSSKRTFDRLKKGELCSRIPAVLNTGLRDWSVKAEGGEREREERRGGRKVRKQGEGRRFSAVRADWMSSSRGKGSSISTTSRSIVLCGCWRLSSACRSIGIPRIRTERSGRRRLRRLPRCPHMSWWPPAKRE